MTASHSAHIGFLGLGSLGTLMAWHCRASQPVALPRDQRTLSTRRLTDRSAAEHNLTLPAWDGSSLDWLIVTTKAGDTLSALKPWQPHLSSVKRLVLLQNGMGQHEACADWLQQQQLDCELWAAISTEGAYRADDDGMPHIVYAGEGSTLIGPLGDYPSDIPLPTGFNLCTDIRLPMREKLAINAVINPLTGKYRCRNGELLENPAYKSELLALATEIDDFFIHQQWPLASALPQRAVSVAEATAANRSSTLQDIIAGRPTELNWICGYLLQHADDAGYSLPITAKLFKQLQAES